MTNKNILRELPLYFMILPAAILILIYNYGPMIGIVIAFLDFNPLQGIFHSRWIGMDNFLYLMNIPDIWRVLYNTVFIAVLKILAGLIVPIVFALLLNEISKKLYRKYVQTVIYLPYFLSWIIVGGIIIDLLSTDNGIVNNVLVGIGLEPIFFLGNNSWFPLTMVVTDTWKNFGYSTIIYIASLTMIDQTLYESAVIDGANRIKQTLHVTLPGMLPTIVLLAILSLGNVLNAGFDQIFNLYSPAVYKSGDIIDTFVYRIGILDAQYGVSTAAGLFKSVVSFVLIVVSYKLAYKFANYRVF